LDLPLQQLSHIRTHDPCLLQNVVSQHLDMLQKFQDQLLQLLHVYQKINKILFQSLYHKIWVSHQPCHTETQRFVLLQMKMEFCGAGLTTKVRQGGKIHEPKT
jgi:hypothetical protein